MAGVTTIALLERRPDISRDLFTRYWRDVHGVMAARIPGFEAYIQHHVTRIADGAGGPDFEGIAVVHFASDDDRGGLASSPISSEIVRDEPSVFGRALLYNLAAEDSRRINEGAARDRDDTVFLLFRETDAAHGWSDAREREGCEIHMHDLSGADPSQWNGIETDAADWNWLVQCWPDGRELPLAGRDATAFRTDGRYVMVENGRPTALGLRGADALRTIRDAGADNQLDRRVEKLIYGL